MVQAKEAADRIEGMAGVGEGLPIPHCNCCFSVSLDVKITVRIKRRKKRPAATK
jgi:phosphoribosyl 1,2-cyclic phosphodiesterase